MIYYVTYKIDGRFTAAVDADSMQQAMLLASVDFECADFEQMETVNAEVITVEDENGNFVYEK